MQRYLLLLALTGFLLTGCSTNPEQVDKKNSSATKVNEPCCDGELTCKLTSAEMQLRRETVIASLKKQILEKKELKAGYAFKFPGTDEMVDELTEFIKTERECCGFFSFHLSVSGDKREAWLELSGGDGIKDFITAELGM